MPAVVAVLVVAFTAPAMADPIDDELRLIAERTTHGWTQDHLSVSELSERLDRGERLTISCSSISQLAIHRLRTRLDVDARIVASVTLEELDGLNDGHVMVEVADRARNRWELYDLDNNRQPVDVNGEPLTLGQFVNARERRYRILAHDQLVDWTGRPEFESYLGWIYEPGGMERFYDRVLQMPMYYGAWVVDVTDPVMALVWRISEDFMNAVDPGWVHVLTGPPYQAAPVARLAVAAPARPFTDEPVAFDASSSSDPDGTIVSYSWDFDGNGTFDETNATATSSRSFSAPGTFTVRLRVTDDHGYAHVTTRSLTVRSRLPRAAFSATPATAGKGETVLFDGAASSDEDGTIVKFEWDLDGTGFVEGPPTTSRRYAAAGAIAVRLRVTDNDGRIAERSNTVTVTNAAPRASLSASTVTPAKGADVTFDASGSVDADGEITGYAWDLDGDGSFETAGGAIATIARRFAASGPATVGVRVIDKEGASADAAVSLTVVNAAPRASLSASTVTPAKGADVTFDASGSVDADGEITGYAWDLDGDGSFETAGGAIATIARRFAASGPATVGVRAVDDDGATAQALVDLTVAEPPQPPVSSPMTPESPLPGPHAAAVTPSVPRASAAPVIGAVRGQRLKRQRGVRVRVSCPAACRLTLAGTVLAGRNRLRLARTSRALAGGRAATLTVRVDRRDLRILGRVRKRARATITLTWAAGGERAKRRLAVTLAG